MIRVLIADDEPMIRAGVRAVLATDPDIAHVSSILGRLGVDNRAAAAVMAHEAGIVPPPEPF